MSITRAYKTQAQLLRSFSWLAVSASAIVVYFSSFRFGVQLFGTGYQDDFFYYAQIARNLAFHGNSSFDGIHKTNGYHPLWLIFVTAVTRLFAAGGALHASTIYPFWAAMAVVQMVLILLIAFFTLRLCEYFYTSAVLCFSIQILCITCALTMLRTGMEVGLTWALALGLLCFRLRPAFKWSAFDCITYGLLSSLMILSRLDSVLLVALLFLFDFAIVRGDMQGRVRHALLFGVGLMPLVAYLVSNEVWFRLLTPISGQAKQLRFHRFPSLVVLQSLYGYRSARDMFWLFPCIALTLYAVVQFARPGQSKLSPSRRPVILAVLLFPLLQLAAVSVLSDWPLWMWYFYPWLLSAIAAAFVLSDGVEKLVGRLQPRLQLASFGILVAALLSYSAMICVAASPSHNDMYLAAIDIHDFAQKHPGTYAMGDRAGVVGYLIDEPLIQLEGLVMDKGFLNNIEKQRELADVLREYNVRYYVATRASLAADGCYSVKEPWQAGPDSPAMHDRICAVPVATFKHHQNINLVFDLQVRQPKSVQIQTPKVSG